MAREMESRSALVLFASSTSRRNRQGNEKANRATAGRATRARSHH